MLKDLRSYKRKKSSEEIENVPVNPKDSIINPNFVDGIRAPLHTIPEPTQIVLEQESGYSKSKIDRNTTPSKGGKTSGSAVRTPEKQGFSLRSKFGWASKNGADDGDATHNLHQFPVSSRGSSNANGGLPNVTPRSVRTTGRSTTSYSESSSISTFNTPTKSVTKPTASGFTALNGARPPMSIGARFGNPGALSKGIPYSSTSVVNTVQVPDFELKEDPSFWMDHNVQVLIRVRPLNNMERGQQGYNRCLKQENAQSISWVGQQEARFTFDHVACETTSQEMLFRVAGLPMVENCLSGYNSCMFAYGQTGSGKTHTMLGEIADLDVNPSAERGMTPRIFEFLFARIRAEEEIRRDEKLTYNCKCSFLEIYNEQITDLLDPSCTNLLLREDMKTGVYVENLTEFEVNTVNDILCLLTRGAANRKVAATNMNRESSRSHSVFTCVIESRWEKDSTTNLRFARLNLVDLAGSERQKASGAEGERLKEAASINKSLSTLGHVIMVLVDVAQGKQRHIPYRDSRLTFLLQDSLGGNSKTMIIANVSPSICSAAETLSTLKFAQRAKLIQNNAIVNEDASGNVMALQHQIHLLKEELAVLKRQNVSRSLSYRSAIFGDADRKSSDGPHDEETPDMVLESVDGSQGSASLGIVRLSTKQMQSLETTLTGALRREQMADTSMKQLEAEIAQLNRLVRQREEDTQCTKMMLKFREDKIQRMESLVGGLIPSDAYLLEETNALSEELKLLQVRADRNPEVTRFALENIRLLEKIRKFQDFYEEGERELLITEVSELRDQEAVVREHNSNQLELTKTQNELENCRNNLNSCSETNAKLTREIEELHSQLNSYRSFHDDKDFHFKSSEEASIDQAFTNHLHDSVEKETLKHEIILKHTEEVMNLELELDILKNIIQEERSSRISIEENASSLGNDLEMAKERYSQMSKQLEDAHRELKDARSVIEALESQILSMSELEDLKRGDGYLELLSKKDHDISILQEQIHSLELRNLPVLKHSKIENLSLQDRLKGVSNSLEKAKRLNLWYKSDRAFQVSNEQETEEVRRQVEAETAEVIVCLEEELMALQQQVTELHVKEVEAKESLMMLETEKADLLKKLTTMTDDNKHIREELISLHQQVVEGNANDVVTKESLLMLEAEKEDLREKLLQMTDDNERLHELIQGKDEELNALTDEWERLAFEIEEVIADGHDSVRDASDEVDLISRSFSQRIRISEQVGRMVNTICEKDLLIDELRSGLEDAEKLRSDMELKVRSLRGAALAITEQQQNEKCEKEKEVLALTSALRAKQCTITEIETKVKLWGDHISKTEICATAGFVIVNRLSERNSDLLETLKHKEIQLNETRAEGMEKDALCKYQVSALRDAEQQIKALRLESECSEEICTNLKIKLAEEQEVVHALERKLSEIQSHSILETKEKLDEFRFHISTLSTYMNEYAELEGQPHTVTTQELHALPCEKSYSADIETCPSIRKKEPDYVGRPCKDASDGDTTIVLLKKEVELALGSLREVQAQMAKLLKEKDEIKKSEIRCRINMEGVTAQVLNFQTETDATGKQFDLKLNELEQKLLTFEKRVKETKSYWIQKKEVLEFDLRAAKMTAAQKTVEASGLLVKLGEAQDTMKESEIAKLAVMEENEMAKLEIRRLKNLEDRITHERDSLIHEMQSIQNSSDQKDQKYDNLERQLYSDLSETRSVVLALEDIITQTQTACMENFTSIVCEFNCLKSKVVQSTSLTRSWLEDIWSEIIAKDCAVSVLHLCHVGVLLEAVIGLNAENGLLHHGVCESTTLIADLKEHNLRARRNIFDRVSRKEDETDKLSCMLSAFEKKILDLQLLEKELLARSDSMGSELSLLMKDLDATNVSALTALLDQQKLFGDKEDLMMLDSASKGFESLILATEMKQLAVDKAGSERETEAYRENFETLIKEMIFLQVDVELEKQVCMAVEADAAVLKNVVEETVSSKDAVSCKLKECLSELAKTYEVNKILERDTQSLREVAFINEKLKAELGDAMAIKESLSSEIQVLEIQNERLDKKLAARDAALESSRCSLQIEMESREAELQRLRSVEEENVTLQSGAKELKANYCRVLEDFQEKKSEIESSNSRGHVIEQENSKLQEKICSLETCISSLNTECVMRDEELDKLQSLQSNLVEELKLKSQDLEIQSSLLNSLKAENCSLRNKLIATEKSKDGVFSLLALKTKSFSDLLQSVNIVGDILQVFDDKYIVLVEKMLNDIRVNDEMFSRFIGELECLENSVKELMSDNLSLQTELARKDEVLKGLLFELNTLQETASNAKDQHDEFEEIVTAMKSLKDDLTCRAVELEEAIEQRQVLEAQFKEKTNFCSKLEMDLSTERKSHKIIQNENVDLRAQLEDVQVANASIEEELKERGKLQESLEEELFQMENTLGQMNALLEGLKNDLNKVTSERDHLNSEVFDWKEKFEAMRALAEENEAISVEARQIAESTKAYAEEKEEEVKLLERSVEELESTVDVLQNQSDIVRGEAERQRLQREDLEMELHSIRNQMLAVQTSGANMKLEMQNIMNEDADLQRHLQNKESDLQEARKQIKDLEKNMAEKDAEISRCIAHISELNLHAEAQACEYKQKFKTLEAMAEPVKPEPVSSHATNSMSTKPEKYAVKSRGSGSPFKCIGLGLTQQIKSEKDEELTAGRIRIEELEALAVNRQKEIFMLNARLAAAESMTHDVIRDLLGVKLDMTNYASLVDHQQVLKVTDKGQHEADESSGKDREVVKLKQQLNVFIEERQGWLEEINQRHAEMVALQVACEKLRQRDQFLTTENEMLKIENVNHKKKVMDLEDEAKKLSGQQNLQQRIHHHAKIKEENNVLRAHNEDLSAKLRRSEIILSRVKEELARYRASEGRSPFINFDEEQRLHKKLKETEEERLQLAQKLLCLCTSILKAAGITRPVSDISLSGAEDALEQLKNRVSSLEREVKDIEFKSRITSEKVRLSELKQQ
ncbi:kinesin-like protein KIN-12D isoform X2 [Papaver somniferum]|uniref:kinesin-like protein KIN-12D isoform X2 n=1 Tax=Papaver somniferum TaxID=3469 RepID=UPI000E6FCC49|nr:kinesin-like protein KIN-12D isoform X2 [Papaver somniferum]